MRTRAIGALCVVLWCVVLASVVAGQTTKPQPERLSQLEEVKQASARPHVSFKVCEISLRNQKVDKSQLLPNVGTVPDGIGEIVAKQKAGWGYIKAVH